MTLTDLIPFRGTGVRRAVDKVAALRDENRRLLARQVAADDFFAVLMNDVTVANAAWELEKRARGEAEEAAGQMRMERDDALDDVESLRKQLAPFLAAQANANRIPVPPMVRRIDGPEDEATAPIDVRPLWAVLNAPCAECSTPVPAGTTFCSARCRNAADCHDDMGDL